MINTNGLLCLLASTLIFGVMSSSSTSAAGLDKQEHYEWRIYRIESQKKHDLVNQYLKDALVPALNRHGIDRVGVFVAYTGDRAAEGMDYSISMLIPYPTFKHFSDLNDKLEADDAYQTASASFMKQPLKDPAYTRIDSSFMKAFAGMPVIEMPSQTKAKKPRLFELRTYESHNAMKAKLKVDMFNAGEIQIMRESKMGPVFYGETLVGKTAPNLTYILSFDDMAQHDIAWTTFRSHPDWLKMKVMKKYAETVSKIEKWFLVPTDYSQI